MFQPLQTCINGNPVNYLSTQSHVDRGVTAVAGDGELWLGPLDGHLPAEVHALPLRAAVPRALARRGGSSVLSHCG